MRVLLTRPGPSFSVADVARGWVKGLQANGVEVLDFNFDDRLEFYARAHHRDDGGTFKKSLTEDQAAAMAVAGLPGAVNTFEPDLMIVVSGFYVPPRYYELWKSQGIPLALVCTESPYEDDRQIERAEYFDIVVVNDPTNLEAFRKVQPRTWYVPHAYDPDVHRPGPATPSAASDFCFVGTGYPSRIEFLAQVDFTGIEVALAGNWAGIADTPLERCLAHNIDRCADNTEAVTLYRSTKASANLYRREAERPELVDGWSMGPREVELAATGCFYLSEARGENREVLPMVPTFNDPADFESKLRYYLAHDDAREAISMKAREAIVDRTFARHAAEFLRTAGY